MLAANFTESRVSDRALTSLFRDFRERIRVNGEMIPKRKITEFVKKNKQILDEVQPSFFEMTVALALLYFNSRKIDIAVIETGMGGRLDSTNIITPVVSVITNISYDHTQYLGNSPALIAGEKAGIIKPFIPVVIGDWNDETKIVFKKAAEKNKAPLSFVGDHFQTDFSFLTPERMNILQVKNKISETTEEYKTDLLGIYQQKNIPTALQTINILRSTGIEIPENAIREGLEHVHNLTGFRGRWEEIGYNPLIICDTAHNTDGLSLAVQQIKQISWKNLHFILGVVKDKDINAMLKILPPEAKYYFTRASIPRAMEPEILMAEAKKTGLKGEVFPSVYEALKTAKKRAEKEDLIFVGGSTFIVAEALPKTSFYNN